MSPHTLQLGRWVLTGIVALTLGVVVAQPYVRGAVPVYGWACRTLARAWSWEILDVALVADPHSPSHMLRLRGAVLSSDHRPRALVVSSVQQGATVETLVVFWTLLVLWPMPSMRRRLALLAVGLPIFLLLETAMTVAQLLEPLSYASAVLAGTRNPTTFWEQWSHFLEAGGRFAVEVSVAVMTIALVSQIARSTAR